jgi:endonuclease/exonuclease/phosphatase family metal-dependent hydrolase
MFGKKVLKWIILAANFVAILFMILTLIGAKISPEKILFPSYFALFYPFILILNIGFVTIWLFARKCFFLLSLSILLFSSAEINETFPVHIGKTDTIQPTKTIHFLTYNTMACGSLVKHTHKKPNKVIQYILDTDADIVCLQEFTVSNKKEYLTHSDIMHIFRKYPYKHIQYRQKNVFGLEGVATFSKFPIVFRRMINYPSGFNISIYTDIYVNGEIIRVVNNHLESNKITENDKKMTIDLKDDFDTQKLSGLTLHFTRKLGSAYKMRAYQADEVAKVIESSPYKIIACGDFNDVPVSYAYTKVKGKLNDAFEEIGNGLGWTFNDGFYHFRIDYILYDSTAFAPVKYLADKVNYSDHYPVLCELQMK